MNERIRKEEIIVQIGCWYALSSCATIQMHCDLRYITHKGIVMHHYNEQFNRHFAISNRWSDKLVLILPTNVHRNHTANYSIDIRFTENQMERKKWKSIGIESFICLPEN